MWCGRNMYIFSCQIVISGNKIIGVVLNNRLIDNIWFFICKFGYYCCYIVSDVVRLIIIYNCGLIKIVGLMWFNYNNIRDIFLYFFNKIIYNIVSK